MNKRQPTPQDIQMFNKLLKGSKEHGTKHKCPHCNNGIPISRPLQNITTEEWRKIFGCNSRQAVFYRLKKGAEFGWINRIDLNSRSINIKPYYPFRVKQKLKAFNKKLK